MKASITLKQNIEALLRKRGNTHKDLAQWTFRSQAWISKILKEPRRNFSWRDVDRIAEFFGMKPYELLTPGVTEMSERRSGRDRRRSDKDRRQIAAQRAMLHASHEIDAHHPRREPNYAAATSRIRRLADELEKAYQQIRAELSEDVGRQAPRPGPAVPKPSARSRTPHRSDPGNAPSQGPK